MKTHLLNTLRIVTIALFFVLVTMVNSLLAVQETKRVFVLNSFHRGYTWTDNMLRGIDDALGKSGIRVETYVTFMDMKRIPLLPQYFQQLKELIRAGYKGVHFDVVLACDNDAFEFTKKYRDELFPGVPVVFSSINDFDERMLEGRRDITGTSENTDYSGTIKAALKLFPATKNIVVVADNTTTGKAHRSAVEKIRSEFPQNLNFPNISLADMTMDELAGKLSKLDSGSIVLLLQHFVDKTGATYTVQQSTPLLTKSSSVPVFVLTDIRMGLGALGGHVVSGYHHGEAAAQMAVKILQGTDVKTIPVLLDSPNKYMFDYSVMQRFKISDKDLPNGSILINKPVSLLAEYRPYLYLFLSAFIVLSCFIAYMLLEIRRRRKTESALRLTEASLQLANDSLKEQFNKLQMREESLRNQKDELLSIEEMLRVQIDEYENSQKLLKEREESLNRQNTLFSSLLKILPIGVFMVEAPSGKPLVANEAALNLLGRGILPDASKENLSHVYKAFKAGTSDPYPPEEMPIILGMSGIASHVDDLEVERPDGTKTLLEIFGTPVADDDGNIWASLVSFIDITERKRIEESIKKRIVALTQPLESGYITFEELFNINDVQRLQDEFAKATGVASIITHPNGTPLTAPSNFTRLCNEIIRATKKGCASCYKSDAALGRYNPDGPNIQPCLSGGLWDAGAGITVAGQHIANWLIGQVRDETQSEDKMIAYAREIEVDEALFIDAFREVPSMPQKQFEQVAQALFTLANQLSSIAYQNVQQARFINERKQSEEQLKNLTQRLQLATSSAHLGVWDWNVRDNTMVWDDRMFEMYGTTPEEFPNSIDAWMNGLYPEDKEFAVAECQAALNREKDFDTAFRVIHPDGTIRHLRGKGLVIWGVDGTAERMIGINYDITEAKKSQEEKNWLENQLLQAQKMESVGRLAGGVAHDFNNMLSVILGHAELALEKSDPNHPICNSLDEIRKAAERSAELTQQLLAFARKQTILPKVLNLNDALSGMLKMLQRLIGEDIQLDCLPEPNLGYVKMDPSQINQILANLCVNARDSIADVGKITIETGNCLIDEEYCAHHIGFVTGEFVRLTVSDDGCGMDKETLTHIFEPFFTTKGDGKGTGLGLAMVYGIVKQNRGFINIYSEPGIGTSFMIYLPRHVADDVVALHNERATEPVHHGHGTILLVEDEEAILNMADMILTRLGYTVLAANSADEAIRLASEHTGGIDLLMTDVVMPGMNGRDLEKHLHSLYPQFKTLFMSGYTANVIAHHGVLDKGVHFIQKPFSLPDLTTKVREVIDSN